MFFRLGIDNDFKMHDFSRQGGGSADEEDLSAARQRRGNSKTKEGLISSDTTAVKRVSYLMVFFSIT